MDRLFNHMDFLVKHWGGYLRHFPSNLPVTTVNYIDKKNRWDRKRFEVCAFSLILRGRGSFHRMGRMWTVKAPCVITQWPGEYLEYGPAEGESWDECYIVYDPALMPRLHACKLVDQAKPVWPIHDIDAVWTQLDELVRLSNSPQTDGVADRVDRVCERLVLETWMTSSLVSTEMSVLQTVLANLRKNPGQDVDFDALAARHGLSPSTFRRRWLEAVGKPPARYLQELRMREACRLLVETNRPIHEIAGVVGFVDELYFSRRFRQELRQAPRDYRKAYQIGRGRR
ncbi:MAG: AraC family transcriptional regulator [Rariglobus sp.]|jgi:AraC-like DNA-binding protein|nr:AraC family transcriptional regulator [Rariglobus sp.]